jgi:hypothetical protein
MQNFKKDSHQPNQQNSEVQIWLPLPIATFHLSPIAYVIG